MPEKSIDIFIALCPVCGKESGLLIDTRIKFRSQDFKTKYKSDFGPCEKCNKDLEKYKDTGFLFIVIDDDAQEHSHKKGFSPWLAFKYLLVLDKNCDFIKSIDSKEGHEKGGVFMYETEARKVGLVPVEEVKSAKKI